MSGCEAVLLLTDLHSRVLDGDRTALEVIAERLLPAVRRRLRRAFCRASEETLHDSLVDAFMDYALSPTKFDASSGESFERSLYRAAWRNAANSVKSEQRRARREAQYATDVAPSVQIPNTTVSSVASHPEMIEQIIDVATKAEREALTLWLNGEHRTEPLASALGVAGVPGPERRRAVKQFKDRIMRRVARSRRRRRVGANGAGRFI